MAEAYEVVERFSQQSQDDSSSAGRNGRSREAGTTAAAAAAAAAATSPGGRSEAATARSAASPRPGSRGRERAVSPAPSQRQRQSTSNLSSSPASLGVAPQAQLSPISKPVAPASQRISNLIQRQYIYFTTLLQEPEPKWKPVADSRAVTVSQLDSIDRNLVVYRAEATFVGVAVWDLFAAISTPGVRKTWEFNADDDRLLDEIRLPEPDAGAEGSGSAGALARQGGMAGPAQMGNNSRSGLSRRTANGPPSQLWYFKQRAAWPVAARDSILLSTTYRSQDCSSAHHFSFSTSDRSLFPSIPAPSPGVIRSQVDLRGWSIEALNPTTAHVTLIEQSDPKGWTTKSASIPTAMVSAVAGVGAWAIKNGGPPIVTHLSVGAKQVVNKYESDKGRYRLEYELDRSSSSSGAQGASSSDEAETSGHGDKPAVVIPPVIECELRCDLDLWSPNLDLIIDPPPIHVSVVRRPKLSRNGAGGGLWLTVEHASASLGALNSGDDEDDGMADDVARITVRKGDGITSERGVVLINGARMYVEVEEMDEEAKTTMSRAQRSKPKRAPLDKPAGQATSAGVSAEAARPISIAGRPSNLAGLSAAIVFEGATPEDKEMGDLGDDISQALAERVTGTTAADDQDTSLESKDGGSSAMASTISDPIPAAAAGGATIPTSTSISRSASPPVRQSRAASVKDMSLGGPEGSRTVGVPGRSSPRISDRPYGTLRERSQAHDGEAGSIQPSGTTSALSTSFSTTSPMMNVLSRLSTVSTATSSISNTQASGQLRIASGVEPPSRSATTDNSPKRSGPSDARKGGVSIPGADSGAVDKDQKMNNATGKANDTSGDTANGTATASTTTTANQLGSSWKWLTKGSWISSLGAPPAPRSSSSAAAAVLAEDEKRKQEREKAAARAAAKAAAKAKKLKLSGVGGVDSDTASLAPDAGSDASAKPDAEEGETAAAVAAETAMTAADAALAAASNVAANAQTGAIALRNRMGSMQFSLPTLILTAVIAFLFGSLVRALLSPADFVLLPHNRYDPFDGRSATRSAGAGAAAPALGESKERKSKARTRTSAQTTSMSAPASAAGAGFDSQLPRLLQDVLGSFSSSSSSSGTSAAATSYGQEEMEHLLLKALQAGVNAGGQLQQQQEHHQSALVRNVSWREIKRMIEIKGLMAGWDLVIAVVRR
ncbi:unnamed protein product [Tilletia controversa]|uniref:START domain-containing protein n=1 Tax=Tilletia controversa TaxID=13291 RepID=A0A8X7MZ10_9BASI|nr:hypothetical protein CF328_g1372 [Tilletia controversa]KAE8253107.1 hypothetical protein A4X06_0g1703 [Tilletia controversa]CAD6920654.1 unnamed protein product [Tilletia controversa]CAD6931347.1 unnamed protein product [Tilletia controversa]CAD6934051.1 unnamed protein product [Tilletia controversa]